MESIVNSNTSANAGLPGYSNVPLSHILRPSISGGKVALPVEHAGPFTNFKHVQGVRAGKEGTGYPLSKLAALDALIERLVIMREKKASDNIPAKLDGMSEEAIDELIKLVAAKLHTSMASGMAGLSQTHGISMGTTGSDTGIIVDEVA